MTETTSSRDSALGFKRIPLAVTISLVSLGLIAVAFATARNPEPIAPTPSNNAAAQEPKSNSAAPWNLALGDVVVFAPELGFQITAPANVEFDPTRVAARIEAQLLSLRQLYRQQSEVDPALLGGFTLQLTVGTSGHVAEVVELSAQVKDQDFRNAVVAEVAKWNFNEIAPEGTVINCPLLFVREGMDIATVMKWEKTLARHRDERAPAKTVPQVRTAKKK
jgi:hypothetical protein